MADDRPDEAEPPLAAPELLAGPYLLAGADLPAEPAPRPPKDIPVKGIQETRREAPPGESRSDR
jgi:hypothetical protein